MDPKKMLSKEIAYKVKGHISGQTISEMVDQFFKYGNTFLLLELITLRNEVKSLREELQQQKEHKQQNSLRELVVRWADLKQRYSYLGCSTEALQSQYS